MEELDELWLDNYEVVEVHEQNLHKREKLRQLINMLRGDEMSLSNFTSNLGKASLNNNKVSFHDQ